MTGMTLPTAAAHGQTAAPVAAAGAVGVDVFPGHLSSQAMGHRNRSRWFRQDSRLPACLISALLHTLLLVVLALFSLNSRGISGEAIQGRLGDPAVTVTLEAIKQPNDQLNQEAALLRAW